MARKYFGTDGMRGEANKDLTIDLVTNLGLALNFDFYILLIYLFVQANIFK